MDWSYFQKEKGQWCEAGCSVEFLGEQTKKEGRD